LFQSHTRARTHIYSQHNILKQQHHPTTREKHIRQSFFFHIQHLKFPSTLNPRVFFCFFFLAFQQLHNGNNKKQHRYTIFIFFHGHRANEALASAIVTAAGITTIAIVTQLKITANIRSIIFRSLPPNMALFNA
jgi:hypothetical protein